MPQPFNQDSILPRKRIQTPCIGHCSTTIGDLVCKGCKRFAHEVTDWNRYSDREKHFVMMRISNFMEEAVVRYIRVVDEDKLLNTMKTCGFRYRVEQSAPCWAYDFLRQTQGKIRRLSDVGLHCEQGFESFTNEILWKKVHNDFLIKSEAHFDRYFRQTLSFD